MLLHYVLKSNLKQNWAICH